MKIGTMLCKTIVVLTISFLKEVYAMQCTEPGLTMCVCSGTTINCSNRNLAQIPSNIPANTTELRLRGNQIQTIDASSLSGLTSLLLLDLSDNEISNIEDGAFSDLQSLRKIELTENKLSSLKPETFTNLGSLVDLSLFDNMLTTVSANIFAKVSRFQILAMGRNPLICCSMTDWFQWAANQIIADFFAGTCTENSTKIQDFDVSKCPVDGEWSSWSNSTCSVTCGNGILSRNRTCDSPLPSKGGKKCNGSSVDSSDCSLSDCPVDGQWGSWSTGSCSVTCGNGIRYRKRSCDSPPKSNNGQDCTGSNTFPVICTLEACSESCKESEKKLVDGQWGSWSTGSCSVTCGNGIRYRKRSCDSPPKSNNGQDCTGSNTFPVICTLEACSESCKESEKKLES